MKFNEQLSSLRKGERNSQLVSLMLRGLGERMSPQEVADQIHLAHPDLTDAELRHAMETAQTLKTDRTFSIGEIRISKARMLADSVTQEERDFVKDTIERCATATSADLIARSPLPIADATPREQAMAYVATVFPDNRHMVFTATEESKFRKRTWETLRFPANIFKTIADGGEIPNYAIANQFTGWPDDVDAAIAGDDFDSFHYTGNGSFACTKTLATRRLALLEFDALPLQDQARFWVSAIDNNIFEDRLRTLVYSGTKSIHALIRLDSAEISAYHRDADGEFTAEWSDEPTAKWLVERAALSRKTEFSEDPTYRADKACKDPTRLTRFAGAVRLCKDGKRRVQRLLWCAKPTAADIPTVPNSGQTTYYTEGFGLNGEYYKC